MSNLRKPDIFAFKLFIIIWNDFFFSISALELQNAAASVVKLKFHSGTTLILNAHTAAILATHVTNLYIGYWLYGGGLGHLINQDQ